MPPTYLYVIYGLYCLCHSEGIKYVGQTSVGAARRLIGHISTALYRRRKNLSLSHSENWILKHGRDNIAYTILEICLDSDDLNAREEVWIASFDGLTNHRPGGSQSRGWKMPEGINVGERNPMYGVRRLDVSERNKILKTGTKWSEEQKALKAEQQRSYMREHGHPMQGKSHTDESRQKMSEAHKGKRLGAENPMYGKRYSEEEKQQRSLASTPLSIEDILEIKRLYTTGLLNREIAPLFNQSANNVSRITSGKKFGWVTVP